MGSVSRRRFLLYSGTALASLAAGIGIGAWRWRGPLVEALEELDQTRGLVAELGVGSASIASLNQSLAGWEVGRLDYRTFERLVARSLEPRNQHEIYVAIFAENKRIYMPELVGRVLGSPGYFAATEV